MFTGIIEEIGIIQEIIKGEKSSVISIKASKILEETILGDSICVNGVCLTVTKMTKDTFEADVMAETLRKSNIGKLSIGSKVNLERALKLEGRFGGHIVSGHIDGVGEIISLIKEDNATWVTVKTSKDILKYIVMKGSIAIDGISLTVAYIDNEVFKVSIIPHTGGETTLLHKKNGETVNLECDVIGKYIEKFMRLKEESGQIKKQLLDYDFFKDWTIKKQTDSSLSIESPTSFIKEISTLTKQNNKYILSIDIPKNMLDTSELNHYKNTLQLLNSSNATCSFKITMPGTIISSNVGKYQQNVVTINLFELFIEEKALSFHIISKKENNHLLLYFITLIILLVLIIILIFIKKRQKD